MEKLNETITVLQLNTKSLIDIRRLWYLLRDIPIEELQSWQNLHDDERKIKLSSIIAKDQDERLIIKFCRDDYWRSFLKYQWFQGYYQSH